MKLNCEYIYIDMPFLYQYSLKIYITNIGNMLV